MSKNKEYFTLPEGYKPVYEEQFDKPLDTELWAISEYTRKGGYWDKAQVRLNNSLIIRTEYKNAENGKPAGFYTGDIHWREKRVTYGYYEARCRVDNIRGAWSAFWLMPDDMTNGFEIDIFENAIPFMLQTTLHYKDYKGQRLKYNYKKDFYTGFHTYGLDWKKDSLKFYYDNELVWEVTDPKLISHTPTRLELSSELNGHNGKPDWWFWIGNGMITSKRNKSKLPYDYVVDYVKIYDNGQLEWSTGTPAE